jgi:hypothetical protein
MGVFTKKHWDDVKEGIKTAKGLNNVITSIANDAIMEWEGRIQEGNERKEDVSQYEKEKAR